jgi:hypothetical protein
VDLFSERVAALTPLGVVGMLTWIDPCGRWWIAPLGSPVPDLDRPVPPVWIPIERRRRDDLD